MSAEARAAWARIAKDLGLDVLDTDGSTSLVGDVDGRRVRAFDPASFDATERFALEVELAPPLLLGARIAFGRLASGATPARPTLYFGIDQARVEALMNETPSGFALLQAVRDPELAVDLEDGRVCVRCADLPEPGLPAKRLARDAVELAKLAERARRELGLTTWETRLLADMTRAARELRLDVDADRFRTFGAVGAAAIDVSLVASDRHRIHARVRLGASIAPGSRATAPWLRCRSALERSFPLKHLVGRAHRTRDTAFDAAFVLDAPPAALLDRLVEDLRARSELVGLAREGEVTATNQEIAVRTHDTQIDVGELVSRLVRVDAALTARGADSPYR